MEIDLHGYATSTIYGEHIIETIVRQAWEMGERELILIHGHGVWRGNRRPFANTNTGHLGLAIRSALRGNNLKVWIKGRIDVSDWGSTLVVLRPNPSPTREEFDYSALPELDFGSDRRRAGVAERRLGQ